MQTNFNWIFHDPRGIYVQIKKDIAKCKLFENTHSRKYLKNISLQSAKFRGSESKNTKSSITNLDN